MPLATSHLPLAKFILIILIIGGIGVQTFSYAQDSIPNLQIEKKGELHFVDGIDLAKKLKMQTSWQSEAGILQIGTSSWTLGNEWASIKDTSFLLQSPVLNKISDKLSFWLPLPSALPVFEKMLNKALEYDSASATIKTKQLKDIWSVNLDVKDNGEVLELKLLNAFAAESFYMHPNFILRVNGAIIENAMFQDLGKKSAMINRVIPIQDQQSAQLTLTLKDNCEGVELVKKDGGKTLQVVLRKKRSAAVTPKPTPEATAPVSTTPTASASSKKIKTIVIDPGHGGKDPGAVGVKGLKEKDVVLSVGLKLKKKLEEKGFSVKLTRGTDDFIELGKRPKMANDWGGDLFISLHCNAIEGKEKQKKLEGFRFYILREANSENDRAIARRENQAIELESGKKGKNEISAVEWIVLENQLNLYARESERLAGHLVEAFDGGSIKKELTGASQAGFMVLVGAYMPAVLAELGYMTNVHDNEILASEKGQNELAERLSKAVSSFAK